MASGPGYGNITAPDSSGAASDDTTYGSSLSTSDSYSGGTTLGSGTTGGPGFGNKTSQNPPPESDSTRFGVALDTNSYSNPTLYGSGTTSGPGVGNKTSGSMYDSTTGKIMEKVGGMMGKDGLVEKGREKREKRSVEGGHGQV